MKKRGFKVYLFRHGRTNYNVKGLFTGQRNDSYLTEEGIKDAKKIAEILKDKKIGVAVRTSLIRSKETLDIVLKHHPECKKVLVDDRMIERSYGILEGTSHEKFIRDAGKALYKLEVESGAIEKNIPSDLKRQIERFLGEKEFEAIHRGYEVAALNGESFLDIEKRVGSFIRWLKTYIKKNKVNVAISAHGNSIRIFRKIIEKVPRDLAVKWFIPYDKVFEYSIKA